jgi:CRISPR/Cas system-associated exonuclease Cas4 (RecB family)
MATRHTHRERFVSASELGDYAYCRRAWWLRAVQGVSSEEMSARFEAGRRKHHRHGLSLLVARALIGLAVVLALLAIFAVAWWFR